MNEEGSKCSNRIIEDFNLEDGIGDESPNGEDIQHLVPENINKENSIVAENEMQDECNLKLESSQLVECIFQPLMKCIPKLEGFSVGEEMNVQKGGDMFC